MISFDKFYENLLMEEDSEIDDELEIPEEEEEEQNNEDELEEELENQTDDEEDTVSDNTSTSIVKEFDISVSSNYVVSVSGNDIDYDYENENGVIRLFIEYEQPIERETVQTASENTVPGFSNNYNIVSVFLLSALLGVFCGYILFRRFY